MLPLHDWLLLASICALGAMTPGISLAVITRHTLHGGHRAGALAGITHALGIGIWAAATVTGMAVLFHRYPMLETGFSLVGAVFLLWMAWKSWQAGRHPLPPPDPDSQFKQLHGAAWDGFMVAFLNPKVALFFLALFSQFLSADMSLVARTQMVLTSMLIDGGWYVLVAMMLGRSRFLPWLREHHHWVERGTAVLLVVIACSVAVQALTADTSLPALTMG
ncbi:amino acid transporter LysE [Alcanivorax nanhaiticus]|uniref:Amino acid transporter LysE n=1 Tax=Alcanivorax nanhaiticus TaxID=1177154 RepID=A0A095SGT8_9GAMM|nr:LysE family translocator [Alcanivorax nanhaiticus]KGD63554.1 amino acid transporter LysE [Alcanivorax nanhaiticus]